MNTRNLDQIKRADQIRPKWAQQSEIGLALFAANVNNLLPTRTVTQLSHH